MLRIRDLTKKFGPFEALRSVDLDVQAGEIHGLVGSNGSGKTTLLNILFGHPLIGQTGGYTGKILFDGSEVRIHSPVEAQLSGIGMIHQDSALLPGMTVAENIRIGRESARSFSEWFALRSLALVRRGRDEEAADLALSKLGVEPCGGRMVWDLSTSLRKFVEIAREMDGRRLKLLLLDEPTAALNNTDANRLLEILRGIAAAGTSIVYVSHRLEEVTAVCGRVTVFRDGRVAGSFRPPEYDFRTIAECMTGQSIRSVRRTVRPTDRRVLMKMEDLHVQLPGERLRGVHLEIMQGEILGVAGLSGHGKLAFGPGIMGAVPANGRIFLEGIPLSDRTPANMLARGICSLPDDRNHAGLLLDHSIEENIVFTALHSRGDFLRTPRLSCLSLPDNDSVRAYAEQCVARFRIKCRSVRQKVRELSGGNRQKVCLARTLALRPRILLAAEPTRGVDLEAREILLRCLLDLNRRSGTTILIASSELDELKRVCDRIAVVCDGRVTDILDPREDDRRFISAFSGRGGGAR